jgi:predicted Zn-ribbon and HTH transcriptional regulator
MLMMVAPSAMGVMGAAFLLVLTWNWRRTHRPGTCCFCGYDLQGNVSGRCPECGLQLGGDEAKNCSLFRSCPESLVFETAAQRDAAWREAGRMTRKSWCGKGSAALAVLGVVCMLISGWFDRYDTNPALRNGGGFGTIATGVLLLFVSVHLTTRLQRRSLRQILIEKGIPVCSHCGQDLRNVRGDTCPKCRRPSPPPVRASQAPSEGPSALKNRQIR